MKSAIIIAIAVVIVGIALSAYFVNQEPEMSEPATQDNQIKEAKEGRHLTLEFNESIGITGSP